MGPTLGIRLRQLREDMDLTQSEVAQKLNCSYKMISNYELDKRFPDYDILVKFCDLFGVTADYLLGRTTNPKYYYQTPLSEEQIELLSIFNKLPARYKKDVIRFAKLNLSDIQKSD